MSIFIRSDDVMKPPSCFECIATDCKLELVTQCEFGRKIRSGAYRLKDFSDDYIDSKCPVEEYPLVVK